MTNKNDRAYKKGYRAGYNNPGQFYQPKLLKCNAPFARGAVDGITQRAKDQQNNTVHFIMH